MPAFDPHRTEEYARKGVEYLLRIVGKSPEYRVARRLASQAPTRNKIGDDLGHNKKVLILSPRDWVAHVQYESVIAHALRLRGADVSFLTCGGGLEICDRANTYEAPPMPCHSCSHYVETAIDAHKFPRQSIKEKWELDDPLPWPELDEISRGQLIEVEADGLDLGRYVDIPLKWFLCAANIENDPLAAHTHRAFLRSSRRIARGIRQTLEEARPDVVLLLSGLFLFEGIAWAICKELDIDVVTYERAFLQETLVFHRDVPAGFYDFSDDWEIKDRPLEPPEINELDTYLNKRRSGQAFDQFWKFENSEIKRGEGKLVSLFTNLTWDTAVIGRDSAFPNIGMWIEQVIDAFSKRSPHRLVIRIHPSERYLPGKVTRDSLETFINNKFPELPGNITIIASSDLTSSYPLMEASDIGLVYTSTTGLELALSGTPVIVAGETHYRGKGFTNDVRSPEEFLKILDIGLENPSSLTSNVDLARRYAHFFFFRAPVKAPFVTEPLPGLARITTGDLSQLGPGQNSDLDRICDGILKGTSFVGD